jgi:hypothetical protein
MKDFLAEALPFSKKESRNLIYKLTLEQKIVAELPVQL